MELRVARIKPKQDPKTGFLIGGANPTSLIKELQEINGISIADLEKSTWGGVITVAATPELQNLSARCGIPDLFGLDAFVGGPTSANSFYRAPRVMHYPAQHATKPFHNIPD